MAVRVNELLSSHVYNTIENKKVWGDILHNVKAYGAKGDGQHDDTASIQEAILAAKGTVVYIPNGVYIVTNPIRLFQGTTIWMDDRAVIKRRGSNLRVFINGEMGNSNYATGYDGDGNIVIRGGTIDLSGDTDPPEPSTSWGPVALTFGHADGILLEHLTITNGINNHYIELNSSRNVRILNCTFKDHITTGNAAYELVQIDLATSGAFPPFGAYDGTMCENVLIEGCLFENCQRALGTHTSSNTDWHKNIRVIGNHFKNVSTQAIRAQCWIDSLITGNTIQDALERGIALYGCQYMVIDNNVVNGVTTGNAIHIDNDVDDSINIVVSNNIIRNAGIGIAVLDSFDITIQNNIIENVSNEGVYSTISTRVKILGNIVRGANQANSGRSAIRVASSHNVDVFDNTVTNDGYVQNYVYALLIDTPCTRAHYRNNRLNAGTSGAVSDSGSLTAREGLVLLTGILGAAQGANVTLNDNINNYKYIIVATGNASSNDLRHEIARGWFNGGFRPGTDTINVGTSNGKLVASVDSETQLTIISAADNLRYVIGVL